jgi:mxaJ protein
MMIIVTWLIGVRVCADPVSLPQSNELRQGYENRIAEMLEPADYTWWAQRRGFLRNTLKAKRCDVVMGVPSESDALLTTIPYYRSSYVFVSKRPIHALADPWLRRATIGIQLVGDDYANPPPAQALAALGIVDNVRGYPVVTSAPDAVIEAVRSGEVDVAIVWGPLAGYFAEGLQIHRIEDAPPSFHFAISMGVRREDKALRDRLNALIRERAAEIRAVLDDFGVPQ